MGNPPALSPKQMWSIWRSRSRKVALWVGAVSSGKTVASLFALLDAIRHAHGTGRIVIIGKTLQTLERNILDPLRSPQLFGDLASLISHTRGSTTAIILGREVHLIGANDTRSEDKIRGSTIEIAYVDEATLLPTGFWEMLLTRLRVAGARLLATTNPASSQHWLRINYILAPEVESQLVTFHFTMGDNPAFFDGGDPGPQYIAEMKAAFGGSKIFYDRMILGLWTSAEGAVYPAWDPSKHVIGWDQLPPMHRLLAVGMDFGTQHATSVGILGLGYDRRLYLVDELRIDFATTTVMASPSQQAKQIAAWLKLEHLPENGGLRPERMIADPAALAHRRELYESEGIATEPAENAVTYGIGMITSLLGREVDGIPILRVSTRCEGVIKEMPDYVWDSKKAEHGDDAPVKAHDDSVDMLRYVIATTESDWRDELLTTTTRF